MCGLFMSLSANDRNPCVCLRMSVSDPNLCLCLCVSADDISSHLWTLSGSVYTHQSLLQTYKLLDCLLVLKYNTSQLQYTRTVLWYKCVKDKW